MHIFITGGTGLIGSALIHALDDACITVLTRDIKKAQKILPAKVKLIKTLDDLPNFDDIDAVINLAGEPLLNKRWSEHQKGIISTSRWGITEEIVTKIKQSKNPPTTFISGSAIGYYGDQGNRILDEEHEVSLNDFPHSLCENWEKIALRAQSERTRVCILRTGIVLSKKGGALSKMYWSYLLGLGGAIAGGKQYFSWIHIDDMIAGILFLLENKKTKYIFNFTAPHPVTNKVFSRSFAKTLKRPHLLFMPKFVLKLTLGESSQLLLDSQRVIPYRLEAAGFRFRYSEIDGALKNLFQET